MRRKIMSWLLCLCMAMTWLPASAWAAEEGEPAASVTIGDSEAVECATFAEAWDVATNPNTNSTPGNAVITLLKSIMEEGQNKSFFSSFGDRKNITLKIPGGMTLTLSNGFFVNLSGETLTIDGSPAEGQGAKGKLVITGESADDSRAVTIGSGKGPTDEGGVAVIRNCEIETKVAAILGGDGDVTIDNCDILVTGTSNSGTSSQAAVISGANPGIEVELNITGSTITGNSGLYIGNGVTATVTDSTIKGTGTDEFQGDYGVSVFGGSLALKGTSTVEAYKTGVDVPGGTLVMESGSKVKVTSENQAATGVKIENNWNTEYPTPDVTISGTVESKGQGVYIGEGTVKIQTGADIQGTLTGVDVSGGKAIITGGTIQAVGGYETEPNYGAGVQVYSGEAEISGSTQITGTSHGVNIYSNDPYNGKPDYAKVTVNGGTIKSTGVNGYGIYAISNGTSPVTVNINDGTIEAAGNATGSATGFWVGKGSASNSGDVTANVTGGSIAATGGEFGSGLMVDSGNVSLSGGTYAGAGCAMTTLAPVSLADLLADGYGYFRENGSPLTDADLENGMIEPKVLVKPQEAGKQTVPMRLSGYVSQTSDDGETATVELRVSSADPADPTKNTELPAAVMDALTVTCISHLNITVSKAQNEWGGGTCWTASVPTGTSAAPAEYEFQAAFAGNESYYPAIAVCRVQASNVVFKFKDNTILRPETTEVSLVLISKNLPENSEITVRCTNSSAVTPVKDPEKENTWNVTLPNLEDAQYDFEAVCTASGDQGAYYTYCQIIVGDGAPTLPPAVTGVTRDPSDTNSGVTVTYQNGTVTLTGTIEFPNSVSNLQKRVTLRVTTDRGERTVTIPLYRDDSGVIPMDEPYDCGDGLVLNIDVSGLKVRLAGTGTGTGRPSGGSSGSSGGGGSTSSSTTKNPDGSTTTKTENKTTGTVTETTRNPDGSQTKVETKKDGTVTTTETDRSGNKTETVERPDGSAVTTISQKDGTSATVTTDASGRTEAQVRLPSGAVNAAKDSGEAVTLPIPEVRASRNTESAPAVTVKTGSGVAVKVEIPARNVTPGTVAVLVQADGTETVLKSTVPTADGIAVALPDGATVKIVDNGKTFTDVSSSHWAESAVEFVTAREMFSGTTAETFTPEAPMTRAMLMTVLARYDGTDTAGGGTWYEKGMAWAVENGVSDGSNPNGRITREQLAAMLWRYSGSPGAGESLGGFTDGASVSGYAREAMSWAVENGILNGFGDGRLGPQGQATRAQVAQMLKNFVTNQK